MGKEQGEISGGNLLVTPRDGETLIIPKKKTAHPDFMKALHKFQYGECEKSDEGFEELQRIAASEQEGSDKDNS
jgi:hypothetical protein